LCTLEDLGIAILLRRGREPRKSALLDAFEALPVIEKRAFTEEVLRRSLPFDSGPLGDDEIGAASDALFDVLDQEDAGTRTR
jgi:hypothetical protein